MTSNDSTPTGRLAETVIGLIWRKPATTVAERARRRVTVYLIPYLFFLYILAYLDRVNVSVAALGMERSLSEGGLGFDRAIIGFGAGIFFWGYWILEVPSTLSVLRWGARYVFVRILILWGLACTLVGAIGTPFAESLFSWLPVIDPQWGGGLAKFVNELPTDPVNQFYFFRFMLGFFEGGFFPSVILYLSLWFRAEDRAKAIACFMAAIPLSSLLGSPLSGLLLKLDWFDLPGWRWIFILQGIAPVLAGFATLFFLPDRPEKSKWLKKDERDYLVAELHREQMGKHGHGVRVWIGQMGTVLLLTGVYFCLNVSSYGLSMFMPAIIKSQSGLSDVWASIVTALPYLMAFIAMLINGWHSDRTKERIAHVAVPLACLSLGLFTTAFLDGQMVLPVLAMIFLVGTFMYAHLPAFWPIPTMFLGATAAASAIGFINMVGNLGGFVGPVVVGNSADKWVIDKPAETVAAALGSANPIAGAGGSVFPAVVIQSGARQTFQGALFKIAPFPLVAVLIIVTVGYLRRKKSPSPIPAPPTAPASEKQAETVPPLTAPADPAQT